MRSGDTYFMIFLLHLPLNEPLYGPFPMDSVKRPFTHSLIPSASTDIPIRGDKR